MSCANLQPDAGPVAPPKQQQRARGELVCNFVQGVPSGCLILLTLHHCGSTALGQLLVAYCFLRHGWDVLCMLQQGIFGRLAANLRICIVQALAHSVREPCSTPRPLHRQPKLLLCRQATVQTATTSDGHSRFCHAYTCPACNAGLPACAGSVQAENVKQVSFVRQGMKGTNPFSPAIMLAHRPRAHHA